jgi:hypothetical protein
VSVTIIQINYSQEQRFVKQLIFGIQVLLKDRQQKFRTPTLLYLVLPLHQLRSPLSRNLTAARLVSIVVRTPFINRQFMILVLLNSLSNIAPHQFDYKYLLLILYHVRILYYQLETVSNYLPL